MLIKSADNICIRGKGNRPHMLRRATFGRCPIFFD